MPEETLNTCAYHVVRYQPNLDSRRMGEYRRPALYPGGRRSRIAYGRKARRLPQGGCASAGSRSPRTSRACAVCIPRWTRNCSSRLPAEFERQFAGREMDAQSILEKFDDTLSNAVQLAPRKGLLSPDPDAELDRLFREQVEPLREARRGVVEIRTRGDVRARAADYFRTEKILRLMQRGVRVEEFTAPGDPMRMDFSYRRNGTRGFVHSVALGRDPGQAKLLAYTAEAIRGHVDHAEFLAVTEREPARGNVRDEFVSGIFRENDIRVLPLSGLRKWAHEVAPVLRAEGA